MSHFRFPGVVGTSRRKKAPQAVQTIVKKLYPFFIQNNIHFVELVLTRRVTQVTHT